MPLLLQAVTCASQVEAASRQKAASRAVLGIKEHCSRLLNALRKAAQLSVVQCAAEQTGTARAKHVPESLAPVTPVRMVANA